MNTLNTKTKEKLWDEYCCKHESYNLDKTYDKLKCVQCEKIIESESYYLGVCFEEYKSFDHYFCRECWFKK